MKQTNSLHEFFRRAKFAEENKTLTNSLAVHDKCQPNTKAYENETVTTLIPTLELNGLRR